MGTAMFGCGCSISQSMYGEREIMAIWHCWQHGYLYSQDKTPRQMAAEIEAQDHIWQERPAPVRHPGGLYA